MRRAVSFLLAGCLLTLTQTAPSGAATVQTGQCTDGGGIIWKGKAVWGAPYTGSDGITRVSIDFAGWTTNAQLVPTDSTVRAYNPIGTVLQTLTRTEIADYNAGSTWRYRNPLNPPSGPGKSMVSIRVGVDGDGKADCTMTFTQPGSPSSGTTTAYGSYSGGY